MVLKRLWRFLKKAFRKKRRARKRRHRTKTSGRKVRRSPIRRKKSPVSKRRSIVGKKKALLLKSSHKALLSAVLVGSVTHYFPKVNAAVVQLKKTLRVGDPILIKGATTNFRQTVGSLQINRAPIDKAKAGQGVGLEVFKEVRAGDQVFYLKG